MTPSAWISLALAIIAMLAWANSFRLLRETKKVNRFQTFVELYKEYSSEKMGLAVKDLWEFHDDECETDEEALITKYVEYYAEDKNNENSLHYKRRRVSMFYQFMANLRASDIITDELIHMGWLKRDLEIIPKILIPIETKAIPIAVKKPKFHEKLPPWLTNMILLYEKAKD